MQLLYIAAPYRASSIAKLHNHILEASLMAQYYWLQGYAVICPHKNSAYFDGLVDDSNFLTATMLMLSKCTHIALHPKWSFSAGCIAEYEYAIQQKLTLHFTTMSRVYKKLNITMGDIPCLTKN